jgi:monofunctional biosynthetic peptidoglycan transglycosylase
LVRHNPQSTAFIDRYRDRHRDAGVAWRWVHYDQISPHLKRAVLVGEDIGFFSHHGFDRVEMRKAIADAWAERDLPRGASTITQQTVKNLWLSSSWNPVRKVREALLTRQMERKLGKRRILEIYLNVVEFAPGIYGAEAATQHFFGKSAADLSPEEAAQLAAGLPRPSRWHPGSASRSYQRRVHSLLRRMAKAEFLWEQI